MSLAAPSTTDNKLEACRPFLFNVEQFRAICAHPVELHFGSDVTTDIFTSHNASWH